MGRKYFGTDGVRGRVGQFPITPEFVLKLGWAAGKVFAGQGANRVLIGKDTRLSGYMFESALEAGLSAAGVDAWLLGPMPTPAIAYLTRTFNANAGIVISASHNPFYDNGIKFFSADGTKLPDEVELAIEEMLDKEMDFAEPAALGRARRIEDAAGRYIEYCKATVRPLLDLTGMHIVVDAAHGATYHVGPDVFRELGAKVDAIGVSPDGLNINEGVGSTHMGALREAVLEKGAGLGIAFDGDGDRVLMVDHTGREIDGDELLYVIARYRHENGLLGGGVVGTLMSNLGLEKAFEAAGIPFARAKVGDRYVNELLLEKGWQLGGESSGHLICRHVSTTGDGIVAALQVLRVLAATGRSLAELCGDMTKFPQTMINVRMSSRVNPQENSVISEAVRTTETEMAGRGRVLLRTSGTEPVIRVMIEGEDASEVETRCRALADVVEAELG
ncbi:phosphoglucosamine mutase [Parendozoicomonas haliclonae]|uniref:Phosphoglucosamine mutase n=1 Tax=Parendozoicomonas haliclonae TaxID=1960125 RepID=A0A1X7ADZ1_9GAMM|nr:phosphoglucosamine mutase [Parendozoicomonas haliclonae]SMA31624.1 Phosphoglucosamine mutase [Parendozoicomonas haliclonae]